MTRGSNKRRSSYEEEFDRELGSNIRHLRLMKLWSQEELGNKLGLTFQQVQKYESGTNRVACSKLYQLCQVLECSYENLLPKNSLPTESKLIQNATELYLFFLKKGINPETFMKSFEGK